MIFTCNRFYSNQSVCVLTLIKRKDIRSFGLSERLSASEIRFQSLNTKRIKGLDKLESNEQQQQQQHTT